MERSAADEERQAPSDRGANGFVVADSDLLTEAPELQTDRDGDPCEDSIMMLLEEAERSPPQEEQHMQRPRLAPTKEKSSPTHLNGKDLQIATLSKKLNQSKKLNAGLHRQLQRLYANDAVLQLENRVKEKQKRIEELTRENKTLKNTEQLLTKEIELLQSSKDNLPSKKRSMQEELRVYKERVKQLKDQCKLAEDKASKLHLHSFDLSARNKELGERVRLLEGATASTNLLVTAPSSSRGGAGKPFEGPSSDDVQAIIVSQEEDITRLHQRIALMKRSHKADRAKCERLLKESKDEVEKSQAEMETFYEKLFEKERAARNQFLHMKKLKRALHELAQTQQTNERFQPFLVNREMRITNRSNAGHQPHTDSNATHKGPALNRGRWIHEALHHLGFIMPQAGQEGPHEAPSVDSPEDPVDIPSNCVQGRLMPFPPPSIAENGQSSSSYSQQYHKSARSIALATSGGDSSSNADSDMSSDEETLVTVAGTRKSVPRAPELYAEGKLCNEEGCSILE
ncbi:Down syndrome critical region protein 3 [Phytophthora boehmeriae]|uniref:Down syndrome critical region protein 3 n=1 Tax=Phytophthora boehmeriae TaxID=109152 RepID=A0A8T1WYM3_9STRA|nr:Down syndrome critical region protein 3 [Phytophthora boehmeriae]